MKSLIGALALGALATVATVAVAQDKYTTGVDGTFAPHAFPKLGGGIEGFNVDLVDELRKRLGAEIELVATQWSGLLPGLAAGTYDFVAAPTTITEERSSNLLFTEGYLNTDFLFVVKAGSEKITDLKQFKGKTIAVNKGAVYDSWARGLTEEIGWTVESYGTNADAIQAVLSGRAAANVAGNTASAWAAKQNPQLEVSYLHSTGLVWGMPLRKDSEELRQKLEVAIECMKIDGTFAAMHEKWFGFAPPEGAAAVTPLPGWGQPGFAGYVDDGHQPSC